MTKTIFLKLLESFTLRKKNKLLICFLLFFSFSVLCQPLLNQQVSATELNDVDYGLFCIWNDTDKPEFLQRVAEGKFDVLLPKIGSWNTDNTLSLAPASRINDFISKVKTLILTLKLLLGSLRFQMLCLICQHLRLDKNA